MRPPLARIIKSACPPSRASGLPSGPISMSESTWGAISGGEKGEDIGSGLGAVGPGMGEVGGRWGAEGGLL